MNDFPIPSKEHIGGLKIFRFIPASSVISIPDKKEFNFLEMQLATNAVWLNGVASFRSLSFSDNLVTNENGDFHENNISAFYPGQNRELESLFDEMVNGVFLLRIRDYEGNERLLGTLEDPLRFTRSYDSAQLGGSKGYRISFRNRQLSASTFINEIGSTSALQINTDGQLEVVEEIINHSFSLNASGALVVTGPLDYKFYLNSAGQLVFDEFITQ
jgi:hypothetical protein